MQIQLKVANGNKAGQVITINRPKFLIGRAEDCQLKPKSELISRYHCVILSEEGYVAVRDLGSRNGVFVNGNRIEAEEELHNGDRLTIGPLEFDIVLTVALSTGKKPKIESIADVVARTVERDSMAKTSPSSLPSSKGDEKEDAMEWLLADDETSGDDQDFANQQTIQIKRTVTDSDNRQTDSSPSENVQPEKAKKQTAPAPTKKEPVKPASNEPAPDEDQTANLLKNFFQNQ